MNPATSIANSLTDARKNVSKSLFEIRCASFAPDDFRRQVADARYGQPQPHQETGLTKESLLHSLTLMHGVLAEATKGNDLFDECRILSRCTVAMIGQGQNWRYYTSKNPGARIGPGFRYHNFVGVSHFILDHWVPSDIPTVYVRGPHVYDITDPQDNAVIQDLYGDPATWVTLEEAEEAYSRWLKE